MTETDINNEGLALAKKVVKIKKVSKPNQNFDEEEDLLIGEHCTGTYRIPETEVMTYYKEDTLGNKLMVGAKLKDEDIELSSNDYQLLKNLATEILVNHGYRKIADVSFLEDNIWMWIIEQHRENTIETTLFAFIKQKYEKELAWKTYTFPLLGIVIESSFNIGNCQIHYHNTDYFNQRFNQSMTGGHLKESDREKFIEVHKSFIDSPIISATVQGVNSKTLSSAKLEISLSINAIKCFLINESLKADHTLFDVEGVYNVGMNNYFSTDTNGENFIMHSEASHKTSPIRIDNGKLTELTSYGLGKFSEFLKRRGEIESHDIILTSILSLGEAFSTTNLYLRIVRIISYFENIVIPKSNPSGKGQTFLNKNIIPHLLSEVKELPVAVNKIYDCRDKYLHNKIELPINTLELFQVQKLGVVLLRYLIDNVHEFDTLEDIQQHFKIRIIEKKAKDKDN